MANDFDFLPGEEPEEEEITPDIYDVPESLGESEEMENALEGFLSFDDDLPEEDFFSETDSDESFYDDEETGEIYEQEASTGAESQTEPADWSEPERLRLPRAQGFRQRLQNQVSMLPLALYLLALGGFLIARQQQVEGLPDLQDGALAGATALMVAFTAVFHALLSGRRERGLLFIGLWGWVAAGTIAALVHFVDDQPDATEWWPLLPGSMGLTFFITYLLERTHDARLVWLSIITLTASATAYWITSEHLDQDFLNDAADYWPLLLSVIGIGLLPLAFRNRTG